MEKLYELVYANWEEMPSDFMRYLCHRFNKKNHIIAFLGKYNMGKINFVFRQINFHEQDNLLHNGADNRHFGQHNLSNSE